MAIKDRRPFPGAEVTGRVDLLRLPLPFSLVVRPEMAGLRRPMVGPVSPTLKGGRPKGLGRTPSPNVVIAEVPQARAVQDKVIEILGPQVRLLVATEGDQASFALGRLLPVLVEQDDVPATRRLLLPPEVRRPQEGQDEAEDGRLHEEEGALRVVVAAIVGGLVGATPTRTDDVTNIQGRPHIRRPTSRSPSRLPYVEAERDTGDTVTLADVAPRDATGPDLAPAFREGRDIAVIP